MLAEGFVKEPRPGIVSQCRKQGPGGSRRPMYGKITGSGGSAEDRNDTCRMGTELTMV
jgi:hypothetical protein